MDMATTRQAIADALSAIPNLIVKTRTVRNPRTNDGWVIVSAMSPGMTNVTYAVTFTAVIILGPDETKAETRMEELTVPILAAVTKSATFHPGDVSMEPVVIPVGDPPGAPMYALALTLSVEVD